MENSFCSFLIVSVFIVFALYVNSIIKNYTCENNVVDVFYRQFIHNDSYHLLETIAGLIGIYFVEKEIGSKKFIQLVILLLFLNTCLELILHKIYPNIQCSVGFYGIIIGILIWNIINSHEVNIFLVVVVVSVIVYPFRKKNNNTSLIINILSGLAGIISAYIII